MVRHLNVPLEEDEFMAIEEWRDRLQRKAQRELPSWSDVLIYAATGKVPEHDDSIGSRA